MLKQNYHCPVMIVQGSAGNIAPKYFKSKETPFDAMGEQFVRSETALEDLAKVVFAATSPIIEKIETKAIDSINMYSHHTALYAEVPSYEVAEGIAKEAKEKCGFPYELMVEFALRTQEILEDEYFYLNGYTNGRSSYFPTETELDLGGYEVYWSLLLYYPYFNIRAVSCQNSPDFVSFCKCFLENGIKNAKTKKTIAKSADL